MTGGPADKIALVKKLIDDAAARHQADLERALFSPVTASGCAADYEPRARRPWLVRQARFLRQRLSDVVHVLRHGMPDDY